MAGPKMVLPIGPSGIDHATVSDPSAEIKNIPPKQGSFDITLRRMSMNDRMRQLFRYFQDNSSVA